MPTTLNDVLFRSRGRAERRLAVALATLQVVGHATLSPTAASTPLVSLFDMPVGNLLIDVWRTNRLVQHACERTRREPAAREQVAILQTRIVRVEHPEVAVEVAGQSVPVLRLDLELVFQLQSVIVHVAAGQVCSVGPAVGWAEARLTSGGTTLVEHRTRKLDLGSPQRLVAGPS